MNPQQQPQTRQRAPRCCSFCKRPGHNIRNCNDIRISRFERTIRNNCEYILQRDSLGVALYLVYWYLHDLNYITVVDVPYKSFLMNKGIPNNKLINENEILHYMTKYFCARNISIEEYNEEFEENEHMFNNLSGSLRRSLLNRIDDLVYIPNYLQLYQRTYHPISQPHSKPKIILSIDTEFPKQIEECCICLNDHIQATETARFDCNHHICKTCCSDYLKQPKQPKKMNCPLCRANIKNINVFNEETYNLLAQPNT
jgi:hypothetical protein